MKDFKEIIAEQIAKATNIEKDKIITNIEVPKDTNNGDFAFPCFILAKELRKSPVMIANDLQESIREQINANNVDEISEVNAVNGFLNFKLNQNKIAEEVIKNFNKMQDRLFISKYCKAFPHRTFALYCYWGSFVQHI